MEDHCTFWPDRFLGRDWSHCCATHDAAYASGVGSKIDADVNLLRCVTNATGWESFALVMFAGVFLFGGIFWKRKGRKT